MTAEMRVLLVSEGSGGHLIPAFEVASRLAEQGARVTLLHVQRAQLGGLFVSMLGEAARRGVEVVPLAVPPAAGASGPALRRLRFWWHRLRQTRAIWRVACAQLDRRRPDVVVGFGGWISIPVTVAARLRRIPTMLHEQNVRLGQANRWLLRWADEVALSFPWRDRDWTGRRARQAPAAVAGRPAWVVTGLPIRRSIGSVSREDAAQQLRCSPATPTLLVLGGSQGSHAVNRLVCAMLRELSPSERECWQFIHLTGPSDYAEAQRCYAQADVRQAWVQPYFSDMAYAYALADLVIARAGASTIAELARCGKPAVLIPYPHAQAHQRENVRLVESVGGGVWLDEATATPQRLAGLARQLLGDARLRAMMGQQMHTLAAPQATERLAGAIRRLALHGRPANTL